MFTEKYFGLLLLSQEDKYIDSNGNLPVRPHNDKTILMIAVSDKSILCSKNVHDSLPRSVINISDGVIYEYDSVIAHQTGIINLGISTFDFRPPVLYIVRSRAPSNRTRNGKVFRYRDKYKQILTYFIEGTSIEKWRLK